MLPHSKRKDLTPYFEERQRGYMGDCGDSERIGYGNSERMCMILKIAKGCE